MTARRPTDEQLRQEVRELTDLLRNDRSFAQIRDILTAKGLLVSNTLLVGLISGEDESDYGVFVTADDRCIRFETDPAGTLIRWEVIEDLDLLATGFQAVATGIAMKARGEIA